MLPFEQGLCTSTGSAHSPGALTRCLSVLRSPEGLLLSCYNPAPMPLQVLQRPDWHGTPIGLGDLFRLHKNRREARAALFTHQFGWEVRLLIGSQLEQDQRAADFLHEQKEKRARAKQKAAEEYVKRQSDRTPGEKRKSCVICGTPALDGEDFCEFYVK